jgi:hypothetical protein
MKKVEKIKIEPTFTYDNGVWNLGVDDIPLPTGFAALEKKLLCIPTGKAGGNHSHPRTELFIGVSKELRLIWEDDEGTRHVELMTDESDRYMFVVHPYTPHAVLMPDALLLLLLFYHIFF